MQIFNYMRLNSRTRIYKISKLMNKIETNELNFNKKIYRYSATILLNIEIVIAFIVN